MQSFEGRWSYLCPSKRGPLHTAFHRPRSHSMQTEAIFAEGVQLPIRRRRIYRTYAWAHRSIILLRFEIGEREKKELGCGLRLCKYELNKVRFEVQYRKRIILVEHISRSLGPKTKTKFQKKKKKKRPFSSLIIDHKYMV